MNSEVPVFWRDAQPELRSRFELQGEIGRGGMSRVFRARDVRHGRQVALKVLDPQVFCDVSARRFEREIRVTSNLQHPHILPLLDSGSIGELRFYVMPYIDGPTLRDRIQDGSPLPVEEALSIASEVAPALDHAHRHGVVHRDIKPENVLLNDGHAIVMDFGIARIASETTRALTQTGSLIGTLTYMSPEQLAGLPVDRRSDVYSLACVVYEMLGGRPPFEGPLPDLLTQHLESAPANLRVRRPDLPSGVDACLSRALAKKPADRFGSPGEFVTALGEALEANDRPAVRLGTRVALVAGGGLVLVAALVLRGCAG